VLLCSLQALHILVVSCIDYKLLQRLAAAASAAAPAGKQAPAAEAAALVSGDAAETGDPGSLQAVQQQEVALKFGEEVAERPMLSYNELLLNHEFLVPALTAGLSFCSMTALMSVTPIAMRVS
jgi:hypothetical protein